MALRFDKQLGWAAGAICALIMIVAQPGGPIDRFGNLPHGKPVESAVAVEAVPVALVSPHIDEVAPASNITSRSSDSITATVDEGVARNRTAAGRDLVLADAELRDEGAEAK